jgi:hypothetical protein
MNAFSFVLKTECNRSDIRAMLTIGHKPIVDWTFLRTCSLQNYFLKNFSFVLIFIPLVFIQTVILFSPIFKF